MKFVAFALIIFSSAIGFAKNSVYDFKSKSVILTDAATGLPVKNQKIVVYHQYQHPCITDGIRPMTCVNGSESFPEVVDGKTQIDGQKIEKMHLLGKNAQVGFQIAETCAGQEWHPGYCTVWIPLKEFNEGKQPFEVKFPVQSKSSRGSAPATTTR